MKKGLKLNVQKTKVKKKKSKVMTCSPITSQIDGKTMETVTYFIFLGSKITAYGDAAMKFKTLTPWEKSYDPPRQHIKKERH